MRTYSAKAQPEIVGLEKVHGSVKNLERGDKVVLITKDKITPEEMNTIRHYLMSEFDGVKFVLLTGWQGALVLKQHGATDEGHVKPPMTWTDV